MLNEGSVALLFFFWRMVRFKGSIAPDELEKNKDQGEQETTQI